jgi:hypothetical protein
MAHESRLDPVAQRQYAMQARGMMREGKSALRMLLQLQARRRALAADETAATCAEWVEHAALDMMQAALSAREAALSDGPAEIVPEDVEQVVSVSPPATRLVKSCAETEAGFPQPAITWPGPLYGPSLQDNETIPIATISANK